MSHVVIVGAGVIGLNCAYELVERGYRVTLVDPIRPGAGCSSGNMGWVTPSLSDPVPSPSVLGLSMLWTLKRDSPLHIKPQVIPRLLPWFAAFVRSCNARDFEIGLHHVADLSVISRHRFDELLEKGLDFEFHASGLLFLFGNRKSLDAKLRTLDWTKDYAYEPPLVLSGNEVGEFEPALSGAQLEGGVFVAEEAHVRPESFTEALYSSLQRPDVTFVQGKVTGWRRDGQKIAAVVIDGREEISADHFLVAAGARSGEAVQDLGIKLPTQAGKGYSITIDDPEIKLKHPLYVNDERIAVSPFENALRIGGLMEFSGLNETLYPHRVDILKKGAAQYFGQKLRGSREESWVGMRPMTPDGLPVIGKTRRFNNLLFATAHAMMGITLAPVTGMIIADLIATGQTEINIQPSDPDRFS